VTSASWLGRSSARWICAESKEFYPASWGDDGMIVFSTLNEIHEVPARGGEPKTILQRDPETEVHFHEAYQLPGGRGLLLVVHRDDSHDTIALWGAGKRRNLLTLEGSDLETPTYSPSGHILVREVRERSHDIDVHGRRRQFVGESCDHDSVMRTEREAEDVCKPPISTHQDHVVRHGMIEDRTIRLTSQPAVDDVVGCQTSLLQGAHEGARKILIDEEVSHASLDRADLLFG
jgi:hypothetical protein